MYEPARHLWIIFRDDGFPYIQKWWVKNFWRASIQPSATKKMFGECLDMAVHMRAFSIDPAEHTQYEQLIDFSIKKTSVYYIYEALKLVARNNDSALLKYFLPHLNGVEMGVVLNTAAECKHWDIVQALLPYDKPKNTVNATFQIAAEQGNFEMIKMLQKRMPSQHIAHHRQQAVCAAAQAGHLNVVTHLLPECPTGELHAALVQALLYNRASIVQEIVPLLSHHELTTAKTQALQEGKDHWGTPASQALELVDDYILRHALLRHTEKSTVDSTKRKM